jgi:hypothetical protein
VTFSLLYPSLLRPAESGTSTTILRAITASPSYASDWVACSTCGLLETPVHLPEIPRAPASVAASQVPDELRPRSLAESFDQPSLFSRAPPTNRA